MADSKSVPLLDVSARARQYPVSAVPGIDATLNRPRRGSDDFWFDRARMRKRLDLTLRFFSFRWLPGFLLLVGLALNAFLFYTAVFFCGSSFFVVTVYYSTAAIAVLCCSLKRLNPFGISKEVLLEMPMYRTAMGGVYFGALILTVRAISFTDVVGMETQFSVNEVEVTTVTIGSGLFCALALHLLPKRMCTTTCVLICTMFGLFADFNLQVLVDDEDDNLTFAQRRALATFVVLELLVVMNEALTGTLRLLRWRGKPLFWGLRSNTIGADTSGVTYSLGLAVFDIWLFVAGILLASGNTDIAIKCKSLPKVRPYTAEDESAEGLVWNAWSYNISFQLLAVVPSLIFLRWRATKYTRRVPSLLEVYDRKESINVLSAEYEDSVRRAWPFMIFSCVYCLVLLFCLLAAIIAYRSLDGVSLVTDGYFTLFMSVLGMVMRWYLFVHDRPSHVKCVTAKDGMAALKSLTGNGIPLAAMFEPHHRCFCHKCNRVKNFVFHAGRPSRKYTLPIGWVRFGVRVHETTTHWIRPFDLWNVSYHGTTPSALPSIIKHSQLLLPGDRTLTGDRLSIREGHAADENYCFSSPTINYASHSLYATPGRSEHNGEWYQTVLELRQLPSAITVQPETIGWRLEHREDGTPFDANFDDCELEWFTDIRPASIITGVLIRKMLPSEVQAYLAAAGAADRQIEQATETQASEAKDKGAQVSVVPPPLKRHSMSE